MWIKRDTWSHSVEGLNARIARNDPHMRDDEKMLLLEVSGLIRSEALFKIENERNVRDIDSSAYVESEKNALCQLLDLFKDVPELGMSRPADEQAACRIGEELNELGGFQAMLRVGEAFAERMPQHARRLEQMWGGIGEWMG